MNSRGDLPAFVFDIIFRPLVDRIEQTEPCRRAITPIATGVRRGLIRLIFTTSFSVSSSSSTHSSSAKHSSCQPYVPCFSSSFSEVKRSVPLDNHHSNRDGEKIRIYRIQHSRRYRVSVLERSTCSTCLLRSSRLSISQGPHSCCFQRDTGKKIRNGIAPHPPLAASALRGLQSRDRDPTAPLSFTRRSSCFWEYSL